MVIVIRAGTHRLTFKLLSSSLRLNRSRENIDWCSHVNEYMVFKLSESQALPSPGQHLLQGCLSDISHGNH